MAQVQVGSFVKVSHPATVLNPQEYFAITHMKYDSTHDKCWIIGEHTCWFNANMIVDVMETDDDN
jgi:hypothetical protein